MSQLKEFNPLDLVNRFLQEGQLKIGPWILQTSTFRLVMLAVLFVIFDIFISELIFVKYALLVVFIIFFVSRVIWW